MDVRCHPDVHNPQFSGCLGNNLLKSYIEYVEMNRVNAMMNIFYIRMILEEALNINILCIRMCMKRIHKK